MADPRPHGTPESGARAVALSALLACRRSDRSVEELLEDRQDGLPDPRDRALARELVTGVLRRQETLDWRLSAVLTKSLPRLPALIQTLLRLGAYQLLYLDRIPASAAVDETVTLAKLHTDRLGRDWSGLTNGVLRNLLRRPAPPLPDSDRHPAEALSVRYALPMWLCRRWVERLGYAQAEAAGRAAGTAPSLTLRVNRRRGTREQLLARFKEQGIAAHATAISPTGITLEKGYAIPSLPGYDTGDFYVEDEAAQLIPPLLDPRPGDLVVDACAAPGGKATHLAELMDNRGCLPAIERREDRLTVLKENCRRLGSSIVVPVLGDARQPTEALKGSAELVARFGSKAAMPRALADRILLDAPCSGIGVLRRHPEAKWKADGNGFHRHQRLQRELLESLAPVLRPGGVLVYSTCSTEQEETEDVVGRFCDAHRDWTRESVAPWLPSTALSYVTARGALSTMGNDCGMDGFFAARLRKKR